MLSIVIPCHNEEKNIPLLLERFLALREKESFELVLVNNASSDGTRAAMERVAADAKYQFVRVVDEPTPGYGRAIMTGLRAATGDALSWTHADLQTDPADVLTAFEKYKEIADRGDRRYVLRGVRVSKRPLLDRIFTRGMEFAASSFLGQKLREINAQPKVFGKEFLSLLTNPPEDFSFDLYWLSTVIAAGCKVEEIPVRFAERARGESKSAATLGKKIKTGKSVLRYMWRLRMERVGESQRKARRHTWLAFVGLFFVFLASGIAIVKSGYTVQVVDQIYCRGLLPWASDPPAGLRCQYRSGDDLFEHDAIATELRYLSNNPYQQTYTERIMNGYPVGDAYAATRYTATFFLMRYFGLSAPDAATLAAFRILFASIVIGFAISRHFGFSRPLSVLFAILSAAPAYAAISETWNMALIGFGLVILGALRYIKRSDIIGSFVLQFFGFSVIVLSSVYQFYLYAAISLVFLLAGVCGSLRGRRLYLFLGGLALAGFAALLVFHRELFDHLSFLSLSNKAKNLVRPDAYFAKKGLAMDPLGWFGADLVVFHRILLARFVSPNIFSFLQPIQAGVYSPGPVYIFFTLIGLADIWRRAKAYTGFLLFWFLYFAGPLQLLLSYTVGGPFLSETSVRASYLVFLFGTYAAIHGFIAYQVRRGRLSRAFRYVATVGFLYLAAVALIMSAKGAAGADIIREPMAVFASIALFIAGARLVRQNPKDPLWMVRAGQIVLGATLVLPALGRLFLGANPAVFSLRPSSWYFPGTPFVEQAQKSDAGRVLLLSSAGMADALHPGFPNRLGFASVNGYRNPLVKSYLELFVYERLRLQKNPDVPGAFRAFRESAQYLDNAAIRAIALSTTTTEFDEHDDAFFDMLGVQSIIATDGVSLPKGSWERLAAGEGLALWRRRATPPKYLFVTSTVAVADSVERLRVLLDEGTPQTLRARAVVAEELPSLVSSPTAATTIALVREADGYREFVIRSGGGLLTIPATYSPRWGATLSRKGGERDALKTVEANGAFLGVIVPPGSVGMLVLRYAD